MKQIFVLTAYLYAVGGTLCLHAQENGGVSAQYECLYEYTAQVKDDMTDTYSTILQIGSSQAKFFDYTTYQVDSAAQVPNPSDEALQDLRTRERKNPFWFDYTIYQNHPEGKMSTYSVMGLDRYTYTESGNPIAWTLAEDTDTICGYVCRKATGEYGGRLWTAWYAEEIPVPFGPWKLCGLPGLVMRASDSEDIHRFEAFAFRSGSVGISAPDRTNVITTSREKFVKLKNTLKGDPFSTIPKESITSITVLKNDGGTSSILVNGTKVRMAINGYVPLELK